MRTCLSIQQQSTITLAFDFRNVTVFFFCLLMLLHLISNYRCLEKTVSSLEACDLMQPTPRQLHKACALLLVHLYSSVTPCCVKAQLTKNVLMTVVQSTVLQITKNSFMCVQLGSDQGTVNAQTLSYRKHLRQNIITQK